MQKGAVKKHRVYQTFFLTYELISHLLAGLFLDGCLSDFLLSCFLSGTLSIWYHDLKPQDI